MKELLDYFKDGINIWKIPEGGYRVFTIQTQHFSIDSLNELTVDSFEKAIKDLHEKQKLEDEKYGGKWKRKF